MRNRNEVLTREGEAWFKGLGLTAEEEAAVFSSMTYGDDLGTVVYQCGARIISTLGLSTVYALAAVLSEAAGHYDRASMFIATFNEHQSSDIENFKRAGFSGQTDWVTNPNSFNDICLLTLLIPPGYVQEKEEDDDYDDDDGVW